MKNILNQLFDHQKLTHDQAREVIINIAQEQYNDSEIAAFISVYLMRNISLEELSGFRSALMELCIPVDLSHLDTIDLCGTGGDGKNTFNISTLASFVVAGAGYHVAKHGNYGVSSISGSSNVLENLGIKFTNDTDSITRQIETTNICFLHAPLFHPALKTVGPIRKALGVKTFFNMLGPLVNPAKPTYQSVGVFSLKLARLYQFLLQTESADFCILYGLDGYDEISLTSETKMITKTKEEIIDHKYFGFDQWSLADLHGGATIPDAAEIFVKILNNSGSKAQNQVVIANAATAIQCFDSQKSISDCVAEAEESLRSGRALAALHKLIELC